jgi:inosine triphosphate pyrophosphatase
MKAVTFITGNQNKADFLAKHLGVAVDHHKLDLTEIQSLDSHEVVEHKAREAYAILKQPVLVEDASLSFAAMGRLPGTYIKWFIQELGVDGLARLAQSLPSQTAVGQVCYCLYDGSELHFFDGEMRGSIAATAHEGGRGFGFDAIFINDGYATTRSEMTDAEYDATSYRTEAIDKMRAFLTAS